MTGEEFKLLARGLKAAYPGQNFLPDKYSMRLWYRLLSDVDYKRAQAAAMTHICTKKFPPTIAEFREACTEVASGDARSWLEGWGLVQKLISRYGYMRPDEAKAELERYDPIAARVVENMGWQKLCESENAVADRANFRQVYEIYSARNKELSVLPEEVRGMIESVSSAKIPPTKEAVPSALPVDTERLKRIVERV